MAVFKCKMCGGTIEFEKGATVGVCDSCGTKQTLPGLDTEKKIQLFDRANHYRSLNEFDKAAVIYEGIISEDAEEPEGYWGMCLCKYGIEYVKDPKSQARIPTVNRAQYTSIYEDDNYKKALEHADILQKEIYEAEAKVIDELQKDILLLSQKEDPFDVFICYKETDENGRRTEDSVIAHDLYKQLTNEKYKVFYSRITLEDKLGTAFEPYIFAALNSAKVMLVVGTKKEYVNAVWVKNEWSRYLALINSGAKKTLIPVYKDIDPYDLPEEFARLQAQDISKLGSTQDIVRAVEKLIGNESENKANIEANSALKGMLENSYQKACNEMKKAKTPSGYLKAAESFEIIKDYKDSQDLYNQCIEKVDQIRKKKKKQLKLLMKLFVIIILIAIVAITMIFTWTPYVKPFFINTSHNLFGFSFQKDTLEDIDVGKTIKFGYYEQDNDMTNGKEDIEWIVLAKENGKALVISKYALDSQPFNSIRTEVTWEKCTLRKWLNDSFFNTAFNSKQQKLILSSSVSADNNPESDTNPGNVTTDRVFLLSITEAEKYFTSDSARKCKGTEYCYAQDVNVSSAGNCWWWLRSPGNHQDRAADVLDVGAIFCYGYGVDRDNDAVRPVLWIDLNY